MAHIEILANKQKNQADSFGLPENFQDAFAFHTSMTEYEETPLHSLAALAKALHVKRICVKDESCRFGLTAFKGLGASYAMSRIVERAAQPQSQGELTFVTCTDGNHGKAVAWYANANNHKAIVFMPKGSEQKRVKAIEEHRAKVIVTDMNYDDTVRYAAEYAKEHCCVLVQDTALPGYTEIPNNIVMGYTTLVREALNQMGEKPTHVFVQAGVGSFAGGVVWYLRHMYKDDLPFIGIIEASCVACFYESVRQGRAVCIGGEPYTVMAGLNCGEANPAVFPLIASKADCFIKCEDSVTERGMQRAKNPIGSDARFSAGESGAVGLGFIEEVLSNAAYIDMKEQLRLNSDSVILVVNTEGELSNE
ncbi:MAG: diaminopropionate ammonia-lyase [Clostridiales bacterium]|nr:diaminopropionate ammonia-lyase [Clostridiales bacterium]